MSLVYFKKCESQIHPSEQIKLLLEQFMKDLSLEFEKEIAIKVHFGEKGNNTYIKPDNYLDIINLLKEKQIKSSYIETNVLYRGERTTSSKHIALALEHGFSQLPIIIADGEIGGEYNEIDIQKEIFKSCKIGKGFEKFSQILVMSHFKGHMMAGFGGALKQLAMGFASRGGKLAQHSGTSPLVKTSKCISCGLCLSKCDVHAITLTPKAHIDAQKCVGCAGCIAICPVGAIYNSWDTESSLFLKKLAEYAYAAQLHQKNIYLNFITQITPECDCMGQHMETLCPDLGFMISLDPVAIDAASLDLFQKETSSKLFEKGRETLIHAEKIGLGTQEYKLITLT